jgi:hypothetical protein
VKSRVEFGLTLKLKNDYEMLRLNLAMDEIDHSLSEGELQAEFKKAIAAMQKAFEELTTEMAREVQEIRS